MKAIHSRVTAQGQISVPAEIRKKLGIGPGSVLEWSAEGDAVVVRRAGRYSSSDIHATLFPEGRPKQSSIDVKGAIRSHMRKRHARG